MMSELTNAIITVNLLPSNYSLRVDEENAIDKVVRAAINYNALSRTELENKPLSLEDGFEITNADGTPIDYDALGQKYKDQLCYCDIDGFYIGGDGQLVLMDDCGASVPVDRGDYHIEVHKPEQEEK